MRWHRYAKGDEIYLLTEKIILAARTIRLVTAPCLLAISHRHAPSRSTFSGKLALRRNVCCAPLLEQLHSVACEGRFPRSFPLFTEGPSAATPSGLLLFQHYVFVAEVKSSYRSLRFVRSAWRTDSKTTESPRHSKPTLSVGGRAPMPIDTAARTWQEVLASQRLWRERVATPNAPPPAARPQILPTCSVAFSHALLIRCLAQNVQHLYIFCEVRRALAYNLRRTSGRGVQGGGRGFRSPLPLRVRTQVFDIRGM